MSGTKGTDPAQRDITHMMLKRTGFSSMAELSANIMFATKKTLTNRHPYRPGVPAKVKRFDNVKIDGKIQQCVILEYLDGMNGETVEYAHPANTMFQQLRLVDTSKCLATWIERDRLEKGL